MQNAERGTHRYIAKVPAGNGQYRYFYSQAEIDAYKAYKAKRIQNEENKSKAVIKSKTKTKAEAAVDPTGKSGKGGGGKGGGKGGSGGKGGKGGKGGGGSGSNQVEHLATNATGRILNGYTAGGGKPAGMSDARWQELQHLWSVRFKQKRGKSK